MNEQIVPSGIATADSSRRLFLKRSTALAIAGGTAAAVLGTASKKASAKTEAPGLKSEEAYFRSILQHEEDHVAFLVTALGADARPKPTFQNLTQETFYLFKNVARVLENVGVGAYLGALPIIFTREYVAAAGSIALVEARHAGFLNRFLGDPVTATVGEPDSDPSFDVPATIADVVADAGPLIKSLNGGPALTFSTVPSADNDIAILNFALALEFLEAEFYQKNVARFY